MRVTPHFDTLEWKQPARYGLDETRYPDGWIPNRLLVLCDALEELRSYLICPIRIISGYRTKEWNDRHIAAGHNAAIGSMHIHGIAADIQANSFSAYDIHQAIRYLQSRDRIRIGGLGSYKDFVHVDVRHIMPWGPSNLITWTG